MIIYNVTVKIDNEIEVEWLSWMKEVHIPDVIRTGQFVSHRFCRLINNMEAEEGTTYCIQYFAKSMEHIHKYQVHYAPELQKEHTEKYDGKFVAFRTLLEVIE